jgi:hypothetical protein
MAARLCTMSSCPNGAAECYCASGAPDVCEQHARDLSHDHEAVEIARHYAAGFAKIAKASTCRKLMELIDQAWTECEMRLCIIEAERGMVWE